MISRESLLRKCQRRYRLISLPICGDDARIQSLTAGEVAKLQQDIDADDPETIERYQYALVAKCLVDADGSRLLADDDVSALSEMDAGDLLTLVDACRAHCGFDRTRIDDAKKNSSQTNGVASAIA